MTAKSRRAWRVPVDDVEGLDLVGVFAGVAASRPRSSGETQPIGLFEALGHHSGFFARCRIVR